MQVVLFTGQSDLCSFWGGYYVFLSTNRREEPYICGDIQRKLRQKMSRTLPKPSRVVDLHAEALGEDWEDYAPDELLAIALDTLRETLDAAVYWGYDEIRYIHGKGKGQLRRWVYEELRHYQNDALIEKFYPSYQNEDIVVVVIGF